MNFYDDPTTVASAPAPPAAATPGYFTDGVVGSVPRTIIRAWWLNLIAKELVYLVTEAGLTPSRSDSTQIYRAILALIANALEEYLPLSGVTTAVEGVGDGRYLRPSSSAGGVLTGEIGDPGLANTGVEAATYSAPDLTIGADGRIVAATTNPVPAGATRYTLHADGGFSGTTVALTSGTPVTLQTVAFSGHGGRLSIRTNVGLQNTTSSPIQAVVNVYVTENGTQTLVSTDPVYVPANQGLGAYPFGPMPEFTGSGSLQVIVTAASPGLNSNACYAEVTEYL